MKRMSFSETIFLFLLALVVFGPKKLPEIARQIGKALNEFRRASNEFKSQIEQEIAHLEVEEHRKTILPPSPPPENTASRTLNQATEPSSADPSSTDPASAGSGSPGAAPEPAAVHPSEAPTAEVPVSLAGPDESTSAQHTAAPATEAVTAETIASSQSQESHV